MSRVDLAGSRNLIDKATFGPGPPLTEASRSFVFRLRDRAHFSGAEIAAPR
ncbi:hypothetical protein [Sphingomonas sp. Leaf242]|uniref:hypothetical protein n=1 Tax=Sphingomonas sp. Leaf242 TaxID=1736304 RepID=UPI000AE120B7|nr:hypothetical protein [Sphingomonas sp. Leaf242]